MKKPFLLFGIIFVVLAWFFISAGIDKVHLHSAIAKAPAYAPAMPEAVKEHKSRRSTNYTVVYAYEVDGETYRVESEHIGEAAARDLVTTPDQEVAYVEGDPAKAVLRTEFDNRDQSESVFGAVLSEGGSAMLFAALVAFLMSWKFGWLRRQAA